MKTRKIYWGFKVVQAHWCWYPWKDRQQCWLWKAASLGLSATVLMLDELIVVIINDFLGGTLFDALVAKRHEIWSEK